MSIRMFSALSMSGVVAAVFVALASCTQPAEVVEVPTTVEVPVEVTREVPVMVEVEREVLATREVPVTIEVERRIVSEIEVPVVVEVPVTVEIEREVVREVEITREVEVAVTREVYLTHEVPVTVEVEATREVDVEVTREIEVTVEVTKEVPVTRTVLETVVVEREVEVTREVPITVVVEAKKEGITGEDPSPEAIAACQMWEDSNDIREIWVWIQDLDNPRDVSPRDVYDLFNVVSELDYNLWDYISESYEYTHLARYAYQGGVRLLSARCNDVIQ